MLYYSQLYACHHHHFSLLSWLDLTSFVIIGFSSCKKWKSVPFYVLPDKLLVPLSPSFSVVQNFVMGILPRSLKYKNIHILFFSLLFVLTIDYVNYIIVVCHNIHAFLHMKVKNKVKVNPSYYHTKALQSHFSSSPCLPFNTIFLYQHTTPQQHANQTTTTTAA